MDAAIYFRNNADATETVGNAFLVSSVVVEDSMIIYRLWVVWSFNRKIIILPILSLWGLFISLVIPVQGTVHLESIALDAGLIPKLCSHCTNLYCPALIAWEIWRICGKGKPVGGMNSWEFLAIVVESAAIYSCWILCYVISHQRNSTVQVIAVGTIPQVVGLANGLIHVRAGLGQTIALLGKASNAGSMPAIAPIHFAAGSAGTKSGDGSTTKMTDN
ncbi:hypothetical protein DFH09DRAFT_1320232 [Mycena vulgaris]|nr:hypothetical protein DFH09DRAFT_1320232 [Mycena vulgaris]